MSKTAPIVRGETYDEIEAKILHLLKIYPIISPTMLQGGLGPNLKPALWRPIFEDLLKSGRIVESSDPQMTPAGRYNEYGKVSLPGVIVYWKEPKDVG